MANNIKGITIEIGGNTTKLDKALKDVNQKSKALKNELKEVDKALKLDPKNTELLAQKQKILAESVENTKEKLNMLKAAQDQARAAFEAGELPEEQYRALQREISNTEAELKNLTDAAEKSKVSLEKIGGTLQDVGGKIEGAGKKMSAVSAGIAGIGAASVSAAMDFEDAIAKLSTIADTSEETGIPLSDLETQIRELSDQTGISASEIANNVYDAISAGQKTGDAVNFVSNATSLAKAGFTSSGSALDILTTIMNAYGLAAEDVTKVSDVLINTQNLGKTTVDQLASSMGKVIPTAKSQGVSIENLAAMYAVMTSNGIATAESTTYMNSMLNELGKQGTAAADAFAAGTEHIKEGGLTMAEAMAQGWELTDVLSILDEQAAESGTTIANMFGSAEAGKAATVLWDNASKLNDAVDAMGNSAGATQEAFDKLDTTSNKAKIALNQVKNSAIEMGNAILASIMPYLDGLAEKVKEVTTWFNNLSDSQKQQIVKIGAIVAAIGPVMVVVGKLISTVGKLTSGIGGIMSKAGGLMSKLGGLKGAIAAIASPVGIVVAALAALAAGFAYLYTTNDEFRAKVNETVGQVKEAFSQMIERIRPILDQLKAAFQNLMTALQPVFEFIMKWVSNAMQAAMSAAGPIIAAVTDVVDFVTNIVNALVALLHGDFDGFFSYIGAALQNSLSFVQNLLQGAINYVVTFLSGFGVNVQQIFSNLWNGIVSIFSAVGSWFSARFMEAYNGITLVFGAIGQWFSDRWNDIQLVFSVVVSFFTTTFNNAAAALKNAFSAIPAFFSNLWQRILSLFTGAGEKVATAFSGAFKAAMNGVFGTVENIVNFFVDGVNGILSIINEIPGVSIGALSRLSLPRLAKGGIIKAGSAIIAEAGPELVSMVGGKAIVTPLTKTAKNQESGGNVDRSFTQNNYYTSPKALTPYEAARQTKIATQNMILKLQKGGA